MGALEIIGYIGYAIGAGMILSSTIKKDNMQDLKDRVAILEKEREFAREQDVKNQKSIAHLEGQLASYKEIPLQSIAKSLTEISQTTKETTTSNKEILAVLRESAIIAEKSAGDGGLLVKTKPENPLSVEVKEHN